MNSLDYHRIFHEIKNTVTIINSSMQLLDHKCPHLNEERYWQNAKQEITYLKNMILEISQTGNMDQLQYQPLDLNSLIQNVCFHINDSYPSLNLELKLADALPPVNGDDTKLKQAILNLLKNSAEAMNGTGNVSICSSLIDSDIQVTITDHGGGISEELEHKVFDLFTTSKDRGTGLGLPITKQIIENHGGRLTLQNHLGTGCTFTLFLPIF